MSDLKLTPQILAMYLGCEVQVKKKDDNVNGWHTGRICEVTRRSNHGDWIKVWFEDVKTVYQYNSGRGELKSNAHYYFIVEDEIKPILRRLSSMTDEEADHVWHLEEPNAILEMVSESGRRARKVVLAPSRMAYLLSKHFDLFNLIDNGLAIEKQ